MKQQVNAYDQDDRFITVKEVTRLTSLSRTSIARMVEGNRFPSPVKLGPARMAWSQSEVRGWMKRVTGGASDND